MDMTTQGFKLLIGQDRIQEKIEEFCLTLEKDYQDKELVIVMIMKGAVCFVADLIRHLKVPFSLDFLCCSSYGKRGTQPGPLKIFGLEHLDVQGKHVLLIDDIFDTGKTLSEVYSRVKVLDPLSVKSMVLLSRETTREVVYHPDYQLFSIEENLFVVGYGLDYKEQYRGLPGIFTLTEE